MLRTHFALPMVAAMTLALIACQDTSNSSFNATTHEESSDAGADSGSNQGMNTDTDGGTAGTGATCADATPIEAHTYINQHTAPDGDRTSTCTNVDAPQHFYSFVLPAHERATVHVAPELGTVIARALTSCETSGCFHVETGNAPGDDVTLVFDNFADAPVTRFVSVSAATAGATLTFDIRLDLTPIETPPAGATCADATPMTQGTLVNQHTAPDGDRTSTCTNVDAPQHFYSFVLPAHDRAIVHVAPEDGVVIARALTSCTTTGCYHAEFGNASGDDVTLVFENFSDADVARFVSVSAATAGATITFDIRLDLAPIVTPPAGATCADATPIAASTYGNQHTAADGDRRAVCDDTDAPQHFYSFVLPAHQRATIHVAPEFGAVVARALAGCDATSCLTDAVGARGDDLTLVIDSPGDEDLTKIISVSSATAGATITFDIRIDLGPIPEDGGV